MIAFNSACQRIYWNNQLFIRWFTFYTVTIIAFLVFEFYSKKDDLTYWTCLYGKLEVFVSKAIVPMGMAVIVILAFLFAINKPEGMWFEDIPRLGLQKMYADFLFLRLIDAIEKVEIKQLREKELIAVKNFLLENKDIKAVIDYFQEQTKRLTPPTEHEGNGDHLVVLRQY